MRARRIFRGQAIFSPLGVCISAGVSGAMLALALSRGDLADVAAYSTGAAGTALGAGVLCAGTTLSYVTGTDEQRAAIHYLRSRLVPALLLLVVVSVAVAYSRVSALEPLPLSCGGMAVLFTNQFELPSGDLQRHERLLQLLVSTSAGKFVGVMALALSALPYSAAMATSALISLLIAHLQARRHSPPSTKISVRTAVKTSFDVNLAVLSGASVLSLRTPFLVAPIVLASRSVELAAVVLSVQQFIVTFFTSGLYTIMAIRAGRAAHGASERRLQTLEIFFIGSSSLGALALAAAAPFATRALHLGSYHSSVAWWIIAVLAIPFMTFNRGRQFQLNAARNHRAASHIMMALALIGLGLAALSVAISSEVLVVAIGLVSESAVAAYFLLGGGHRWITPRNS